MEIKSYVKDNMDGLISDLCELIRIPSVMDMSTAQTGQPFGEGPRKGLEAFLALGERMGMKSRNFDNYAGDLTVGTGDYMIGIMGHIDVVPAGEGWHSDPFEPVIKDGWIYGRGSSDDKGGLVASLYAVKYLMDENLIPEDVSIRMIIGADEEEGLRCIEHYLKLVDRLPDVSFVPDGYFPMVNCEKGLIDFDLSYDFAVREGAQAEIVSLQGGAGRNMVPGIARCRIQSETMDLHDIKEAIEAEKDKILDGAGHPVEIEWKIEITEEELVIETTGAACHAMKPELGRNALSALICTLAHSGIVFDCQEFLEVYDRSFGMTYNGEKLGCRYEDEISGVLTLNIGTIERLKNTFAMKANVRWPVSVDYETIQQEFAAQLKSAGFHYEEVLYIPMLYLPVDSNLVQCLLTSYQEVSGDYENMPFSIGGATYARDLPHSISFGPLFPYEEDLMHQPDEAQSIESLRKITEIYIRSLIRLTISR